MLSKMPCKTCGERTESMAYYDYCSVDCAETRIAELEAQNAHLKRKCEALAKALYGLVHAYKVDKLYISGDLLGRMDKAKQALEQARADSDKCVWRQNASGIYHTACGDANIYFKSVCHNCGKQVDEQARAE